MKRIRVVTDLDECHLLWNQMIPQEQLSDLWEIRACFQRHYGRKPYFMLCENSSGACGFLPLSWNEETGNYLYFPGETWQGKTWLEQNHLVVRNGATLTYMLDFLPGDYYLRYLQPVENGAARHQVVDEVGYYFLPPKFNYDFDTYFEVFSHKTAKRLRREIDEFTNRGVQFRVNELSDFDILVSFNIQRFGADSYFADLRFLNGFQELLRLLSARNWLRLTTVLIENKVAAVDLGCLYRGTYTLLAGGTNGGFPGVAKLINLHHMQWACEKRIERVDFLCGNFNWKELFHLTPRPLYALKGGGEFADRQTSPAQNAKITENGLVVESANYA